MHDTASLFKATFFQQQASDRPAYPHMLTSASKGTFTSWYQEIKTTVSSAVGDSISVQVALEDNRPQGEQGYLFKQLLFDGEVVWEADIGADGAAPQTITRALEARGTAAQISVRLHARKASWIQAKVYAGTPEVTVNGQPVAATLSQRAKAFS